MADIAYKYRGKLVDQIHRGQIAVSDVNGNILYQLGNPEAVIFSRSSAKPLQAIPVVESGAIDHFSITQRELAVMCASHNAESFHVQAIRSILSKAGLDESYLQCGVHYPMAQYVEDEMKAAKIAPSSIHSDCSGKHSGMLITAKQYGENLSTYTELSHPIQQRILQTLSDMCDYPKEKIELAVDGCGVPVHAMPLYKFAQGYARMANPEVLPENLSDASRKIVSAMTTYPEMVAGTGRLCTQLMECFGDRIFCKSGAGAFYAVGIKGTGMGIALKMDEGASQIVGPAILETLFQLGIISEKEKHLLPDFHDNNVYNFRNEIVGKTETIFTLNSNRKLNMF